MQVSGHMLAVDAQDSSLQDSIPLTVDKPQISFNCARALLPMLGYAMVTAPPALLPMPGYAMVTAPFV